MVEVKALLEEMDRRCCRGGKYESADFVRFLILTGTRISEANGVQWSDVYLDRGKIIINGTKTPAARREVPMFEETRALLLKLKERRLEEAFCKTGQRSVHPSEKVLGVCSVVRSLTNACGAIGISRLTHHDLRDVFTTTCLERGADIPTVAKWLGHKDGGHLLMKVYNDVRNQHSMGEAAKVSFGGISVTRRQGVTLPPKWGPISTWQQLRAL